MKESIICCEKCAAWEEDHCRDDIPTEPLYHTYCFLSSGHGPVGGSCPGPYPQTSKDEKTA